MSNKKWVDYEEMIYKIYQELEPIAEVKKNDRIMGYETMTEREIDITVKTKIAGHELLIIIQAKDYRRKADVNVVGTFAAVIKDVRASKGVLICNRGFSNHARAYAKNIGVSLCSAHDATYKDWQTEVQIPVLKRTITVTLTLQIEVRAKDTSNPMFKMELTRDQVQAFIEQWEKGQIETKVGKHLISLDLTHLRKMYRNFEFREYYLLYEVRERYHSKFIVPDVYRGLRDYVDSKFTASFIEIKDPINFLNNKDWNYVPNPAELSFTSSFLNVELITIDGLNLSFGKISLDN
ncbi:restriction endonuclease [Aridibaculum aurantiacum]|uniref:restriction endonuclease n=1 Tax=Aridibaculum aurantiacum TaxID=2810307 RepID=UPI001A95CE1E|nr:restriction endonuclease [Aridibaculum aurantiacum]